jgi:hypothetical protein
MKERPSLAPPPSLEEFKSVCREAFRFVVDDCGFREVPCSTVRERFCVRFAKDDRALEIKGEGDETIAACDLTASGEGPMALIMLVPESFRPVRDRRRKRSKQPVQRGQLEQIRETAQLAREHAREFLAGDVARNLRVWRKLRR